jgi:site-specific recombinase XerD
VAIGTHALQPRAAIPAGVLRAVVPRSTAVVPIDKLIVPAAFSGENGAYRLPQHLCLIRARNDYEAILVWVRAKHGLSPAQIADKKKKRGIDPAAPEGSFDWLNYLSNTQRAYLKEAERFLLWAIVQRQKPLSSMTLDDCVAYRNFLADPQPAALWCGSHARGRWSPLWRPFEGPLEPASQRRAVTILKGLYRWLVDQCYLRGNPWGGVTTPKGGTKSIDAGRSFTQAQWDYIDGQLQGLAGTSANMRLRFALRLMYATGLRLSEVVAARIEDLSWKAYPAERRGDAAIEVWELQVVGKGGKARIVPVAPAVVDELCTYLASRGLPADLPLVPPETHLLGKAVDVAERAPWSPAARQPVDRHAGIGAATLVDQMKVFFARCAQAMAEDDRAGAARLEEASAHWLRHTHGSHAVAAGMDIKVVQQNLGHASLATTTIYTTSEERRRAEETAKLWNAAGRKPHKEESE